MKGNQDESQLTADLYKQKRLHRWIKTDSIRILADFATNWVIKFFFIRNSDKQKWLFSVENLRDLQSSSHWLQMIENDIFFKEVQIEW